MKRPDDLLLRLVFIPAVILLANLLFLEEVNYNWTKYLAWSAVGIGFALGMWEAAMRWMLYVRLKYATLEQTRKRIIISFLGYFIITAILNTVFIGFTNWLTHTNSGVVGMETYLKRVGVWLVGVVLMGLIFELKYYLKKYGEAIQEVEAAKNAGLRSQYDSLKNQVNPHFLFNSLNSLVSLIGQAPQRAEVFTRELSSVYRYVLNANEPDLVSLHTELAFIESYYHLLRTRYGEGLLLTLSIEEGLSNYQLPPLTLQLLIENAVKHNVVSASKPLHIRVMAQNRPEQRAQLTICNNVQRKQTRVLNNGLGLVNILSKYRLLGQEDPGIEEIGGHFAVTLPLIEPRSLNNGFETTGLE
ncbi:sensor histidine kinase [Dyadobacter sp. CY326]|uniref:sensor histidine kinase n=1 Tax=Dyadobacter sp. CY326 TaxID=2907300 RepID=UPI001F1CC25E|nr:sensor histidine kinase [Dyadobacter sp. CY326]MCE7063858.1 histidine kinase [Dyadobacter sp. CY326]